MGLDVQPLQSFFGLGLVWVFGFFFFFPVGGASSIPPRAGRALQEPGLCSATAAAWISFLSLTTVESFTLTHDKATRELLCKDCFLAAETFSFHPSLSPVDRDTTLTVLSCLQYKLDLAKKKPNKTTLKKEKKNNKIKRIQKQQQKKGKRKSIGVEKKKRSWFYIKLLDRTLTFHCVHLL